MFEYRRLFTTIMTCLVLVAPVHLASPQERSLLFLMPPTPESFHQNERQTGDSEALKSFTIPFNPRDGSLLSTSGEITASSNPLEFRVMDLRNTKPPAREFPGVLIVTSIITGNAVSPEVISDENPFYRALLRAFLFSCLCSGERAVFIQPNVEPDSAPLSADLKPNKGSFRVTAKRIVFKAQKEATLRAPLHARLFEEIETKSPEAISNFEKKQLKGRGRARCGPEAGGCTRMSLVISMSSDVIYVRMRIVSIVPEWVNVANASRSDQDLWKEYKADIERHEDVHVMFYEALGKFLGTRVIGKIEDDGQFRDSAQFKAAYEEMLGWHARHDLMDHRRIKRRYGGP